MHSGIHLTTSKGLVKGLYADECCFFTRFVGQRIGKQCVSMSEVGDDVRSHEAHNSL